MSIRKKLIQEVVTVAGKKVSLSIGDMLIRGALSGVFLGFATSLAMVVTAQGVQPIVGAILFPVGFVMLALLGLELATGNFALLPAGVMAGRVSVGKLIRNWSWVYFGNLVGSVFYALLFYWSVTNFGATGGGTVGDLLKSAAQKKTLGYNGWSKRMGDSLHQRCPLQLDGHSRRTPGVGVPFDGGEGSRDVAAHYDLLCAGFRTLDRQYVRGPSRNDVRCTGHDSKLAVMESAAGHAGQHSFGALFTGIALYATFREKSLDASEVPTMETDNALEAA